MNLYIPQVAKLGGFLSPVTKSTRNSRELLRNLLFRNEFYKIWLSCVHFTIDLQNYLQLFDFYLLRITSFYLLKLYNKKFPQLS